MGRCCTIEVFLVAVVAVGHSSALDSSLDDRRSTISIDHHPYHQLLPSSLLHTHNENKSLGTSLLLQQKRRFVRVPSFITFQLQKNVSRISISPFLLFFGIIALLVTLGNKSTLRDCWFHLLMTLKVNGQKPNNMSRLHKSNK